MDLRELAAGVTIGLLVFFGLMQSLPRSAGEPNDLPSFPLAAIPVKNSLTRNPAVSLQAKKKGAQTKARAAKKRPKKKLSQPRFRRTPRSTLQARRANFLMPNGKRHFSN